MDSARKKHVPFHQKRATMSDVNKVPIDINSKKADFNDTNSSGNHL
jgi:hypothetical protein